MTKDRKPKSESEQRQQLRHTIKLDDEVYITLDRWKAWIRFRDPANRVTVAEVVRRGLDLAMAELEIKYGQLPPPLTNPENGDDK